MSAVIADRGHIVWSHGFGLANVERNERVDSETIFHLASLTKSYAATVLLQLVDEGRVALDARVADLGIKPADTADCVWSGISVRRPRARR